MQQKKLNHNQRKCQYALEQELKKVKNTAKLRSRGIPHKQVKIATKLLQDLYDQPGCRRQAGAG